VRFARDLHHLDRHRLVAFGQACQV